MAGTSKAGLCACGHFDIEHASHGPTICYARVNKAGDHCRCMHFRERPGDEPAKGRKQVTTQREGTLL